VTIPAALRPHWHTILTISSESGVPAPRIGGTVMIESGGDPHALQRNDENGWSYGLMQIVPFTADPQRQGWEGHHALVRRIAGLSATAPREAVINALYNPVTNLRVGCSLLASLKQQYGSWDAASSRFFLGNTSDWYGQDSVNHTTGEQYRAALARWMDELADEEQPTMTNVQFAGSGVAVPLDVPLRIVLVPPWQTNQRPGIAMSADRVVVHETDNTNAGANAEMHSRYLLNGAEGRQASWHFTVDKDEIVQHIPISEVAWHGGDGAGPCNYHGIAMELCVDNGNASKQQIRHNAEKLAAALRRAKSISRMQRHGDCCAAIGNPAGCHNRCPLYIGIDGYWPEFQKNVDALLGGVTPAPEPVYATAYPPPPFDGTDKTLGTSATVFHACRRQYTAKAVAKRLQYADAGAREVGPPLVAGEMFMADYVVSGSDGQPYVVTPIGTRIAMGALSPQVTVA
jgi:hypothetical protein